MNKLIVRTFDVVNGKPYVFARLKGNGWYGWYELVPVETPQSTTEADIAALKALAVAGEDQPLTK